jgi:hypothetical protein
VDWNFESLDIFLTYAPIVDAKSQYFTAFTSYPAEIIFPDTIAQKQNKIGYYTSPTKEASKS